LSPRALGLHLALVLWLGLCAFAAWWQVGRAFDGNSLSAVYAVEWPLFGLLGFIGWWSLLHTDPISDEERRERREYEESMRRAALERSQGSREDEDPELAAYNDHLASLADRPRRKLFGH
jgi:DNA-binding transcriptional regulator of glucitol operon